MKKNAIADSPEDFDFFVTVGDNLYVLNPPHVDDLQFEIMMNLFLKRDAIKDIPIYPVRGNHDARFEDAFAEVNLTQKYPMWNMPDNY
jgi:hypothetical protein